MKELKIAKICHEANKAFCESISDNSQKHWDDAPQWQKDSAINGVKFALANPHVTPEDMHDNWMEEKIANGWIYGDVKSEAVKTHPCLVSYENLPEQQKCKDYIFRHIVTIVKNSIT